MPHSPSALARYFEWEDDVHPVDRLIPVCTKCGATVHPERLELHASWHDNLAFMVRTISQYMGNLPHIVTAQADHL